MTSITDGRFGLDTWTDRRSPLAATLGRVLATDGSISPTILRLTLAAVMFPHGAQKLLGWFGGYGFEGTHGYLTGAIGLPAALATLVILIEFLAPIALLIGAGSRLAALGIAAVMVGAVATVHLPVGFFMNWNGTLAAGAEGFEFHLLVLGIAAALMVRGSGKFSVDRLIAPR